jgi:hypothetical protein
MAREEQGDQYIYWLETFIKQLDDGAVTKEALDKRIKSLIGYKQILYAVDPQFKLADQNDPEAIKIASLEQALAEKLDNPVGDIQQRNVALLEEAGKQEIRASLGKDLNQEKPIPKNPSAQAGFSLEMQKRALSVDPQKLQSVKHFSQMGMQEFCDALEHHPLEVYGQMVVAYREQGENFSFPAFKEVLAYLTESAPFNSSFNKEYKKLEEENFPFSETNRFIQRIVWCYDFCKKETLESHEQESFDTLLALANNKNKIVPIKLDNQSNEVAFHFACHAELNLPFFIYSRVAPIFPLGVSTEDIQYDFNIDKLRLFYLHDKIHAEALHSSTILYANNHKISPSLDFYLFSVYIQALVERIPDPNLQAAVNLMLFQLLHEDGNVNSAVPQIDIQHEVKRQALYGVNLNSWDRYDLLFGSERAKVILQNRIDAGYYYPDDYKTQPVQSCLDNAVQFIQLAAIAYIPPQLDDEQRATFSRPRTIERSTGALLYCLREIEILKAQAYDFQKQRKDLSQQNPAAIYPLRELYAKEIACYMQICLKNGSSDDIKTRLNALRQEFEIFITSDAYYKVVPLASFTPHEENRQDRVVIALIKEEMKRLFPEEIDLSTLSSSIETLFSSEQAPKKNTSKAFTGQ